MNLHAFVSVLSENPDSTLQIVLPDQFTVPTHFHVTEVGYVKKDFVDCGGTVRSTEACVLQTWVASDIGHRLNAGKLARIIGLAAPLLGNVDLPVEIEYEHKFVSQFPIVGAEVTEGGIVIRVGTKHTACLATELCLIEPTGRTCCESSACC